MKKNILFTGVISGDLSNELISFKLEITPVVSAAELLRMEAKSKLAKTILGFKKWKSEFFTLDGFDNYNFNY